MNKLQKKQLCETIMHNIKKNLVLTEGYDNNRETYRMSVVGPCKMVISDPCYVLSEDDYDRLIIDQEEGLMEENRGMFHSTFDGDGCYNSMTDFLYGVDAGILGICKHTENDQNYERLGKEFDIEPGKHIIEMEYDNGDFEFRVDGKVIERIYTGYDEDEEYEDEYDREEE